MLQELYFDTFLLFHETHCKKDVKFACDNEATLVIVIWMTDGSFCFLQVVNWK